MFSRLLRDRAKTTSVLRCCSVERGASERLSVERAELEGDVATLEALTLYAPRSDDD